MSMKKFIHTDERNVFFKRFEKARIIEAGLTQSDVAKKFGCSQSWVSKVELGKLRVEAVWLNRFAKLYGKSLNYVL